MDRCDYAKNIIVYTYNELVPNLSIAK